jgi:hypothetical protein
VIGQKAKPSILGISGRMRELEDILILQGDFRKDKAN